VGLWVRWGREGRRWLGVEIAVRVLDLEPKGCRAAGYHRVAQT